VTAETDLHPKVEKIAMPYIINLENCRNRNSPTNSGEETKKENIYDKI